MRVQRRCLLPVAGFLLFAGFFTPKVAGAADDAAPVDAVDPHIGAVGAGSCLPGPCLPHASIYPSPDTTGSHPSGYDYKSDIVGFAQLHTQGTGGVPSYGNFLVSPQIGIATAEADHASPKSDETMRCDKYAVKLTRYNIRCEITPARHSALYRFTFPASSDSTILLDVARKIGAQVALQDGSVTVDPATGEMTGGGTFAKNWAPGDYPLYFCAQFSRKPTRTGTWTDTAPQSGVTTAAAKKGRLGAYLGFTTTADEAIEMKIAVSFTSVARAKEYLHTELPDWDFEKTQARARSAWEKPLSTLTIEGATPDETRRFDTALWHAFVQPRDRTGDREIPFRNGSDAGQGPLTVTDSDGFLIPTTIWDDHYTLWDTWKTLFPLMCLVDPNMVRDNVKAFVVRHQRSGGVDGTAFVEGNEYRVGQGGDEVDNVIADAYAKGITGVDWNQAYDMLKYDADHGRTDGYRTRGYVAIEDPWTTDGRMHSGSGTLGFAYNDFLVSQVARGLGKTDDATKYAQRATQNWQNAWDPTATDSGFTGFIRARHADGTFANTPPRKGYNTDFYEGICYEYSFVPTFDIPGMVAKMGGPEPTRQRLRFALDNKLIDFGNEPSFMTVWLFDALRRPYLCSYWANVLRNTYANDLLPGDDDSGAMSSLYCFLTAGLYPYAGQDIYYLHGARAPKITFHLASGKSFTILGINASPENIYVQSATLNGVKLDQPLIHHRDILRGGTLRFVMGPKPSSWGCGGEFDAGVAAREVHLAGK